MIASSGGLWTESQLFDEELRLSLLRGSEVHGGRVEFDDAEFAGGTVTFNSAVHTGGPVTFDGVQVGTAADIDWGAFPAIPPLPEHRPSQG